jgi:hypothetical protein
LGSTPVSGRLSTAPAPFGATDSKGKGRRARNGVFPAHACQLDCAPHPGGRHRRCAYQYEYEYDFVR